MTIKQAKANLKKNGVVEFRGVKIAETKTIRNQWEEYTGRYVVTVAGELVDTGLSLTAAFDLVRHLHKTGTVNI